MHLFIADYLCYWYEFRLNKKAIYHNDRVSTDDNLVFEKTKL